MPIYAFACQACGHAVDNLQRMSDPDPAECPECGADMVRNTPVGERLTLSYRCREHGSYVYSWDHDRLERLSD